MNSQPRANGSAKLSSKCLGSKSVIGTLRQAGASKLLFPRSDGDLQAILINTAGGLTGGDRFSLAARAGTGSTLSITTQAAERAYRAQPGSVAQVKTVLSIEEGAFLRWLPQELILFDHANLERALRVDMAVGAKLLMVEPVVFGRAAMGEKITQARLLDRIEIFRGGAPLYLDTLRFDGNWSDHLDRGPVAGGAGAMCSIVFVSPDASIALAWILENLPNTAGASLLHDDTLVIRMLATDSYSLRSYLVPILDRLTGSELPVSWRL